MVQYLFGVSLFMVLSSHPPNGLRYLLVGGV
jgi:hypothetical protein